MSRMTEAEQKEWEITVRNFSTKGTVLYQSPWADSIIAAHREIAALRKVMEAAEEILANGYDQGRRITLRAAIKEAKGE